jgi:hypothetical protein
MKNNLTPYFFDGAGIHQPADPLTLDRGPLPFGLTSFARLQA